MKIDHIDNRISIVVNTLMCHLDRWIAPDNSRSVRDELFKFYTEKDIITITKAEYDQLKEYEKNVISMSLLKL